MVKKKCLVTEAYEWDDEDVSSNDNEMVEVKVLMALADDENVVVGKESTRNGKGVKISTRKKRILGVDKLTKDPSSSRQTDLVFVKSSADDTNVSIPNVERPWLSEAEGFNFPNHDTVSDYDSADESLVYSTPLPLLKKLASVEPVSGPKTIKSILKSNSTFKAKTLKGVIINEPTSATSKELNDLKLQIRKITHLIPETTNLNRTCDHAEYMSLMNMPQHLKSQGGSSSRSQTSRPLKPFPPCKHCRFNDHQSDDCVNYPTCEICGSYNHDTKGHNRIISLRRGIKPRNPQHVTKSYETYGSTVHTTTNHNNIEWFRRGEALQDKKAKALQAKKTESSNANRFKTPTKSGCSRHMTGVKIYLHKYVKQPGPKVVFGDDSTCITEGYGSIKCNVFIHNHKDHLGKFDEKADDVDDINIAESERYLPDEYLHPFEPSQRYQVNNKAVQFIEPYEKPEHIIYEADQNDQSDQNDLNDHVV
ncbi:hypothetical protein Tco_1132939 [Tanacetum coccineum]|uniref:Retrovirus-related Pol polyprotein from transposon TNT 1-94-like beta-barrel domain-containing protein n=1 Tax=Tanacetum coccineum TaxID=301880 RepID=A0ABQ5JG81_9ASTR